MGEALKATRAIPRSPSPRKGMIFTGNEELRIEECLLRRAEIRPPDDSLLES